MKNSLLIGCFSLFFATFLGSQSNYWTVKQSKSTDLATVTTLDLESMRAELKAAERFNYNLSKNSGGILMNFPLANGVFEKFEVYKTTVMHPDLEAKFPLIRTYIGLSKEVPGKLIRFSISHKRLSGMLTVPGLTDEYIHQVEKGLYHSYKVTDYPGERKTNQVFTCGVSGNAVEEDQGSSSAKSSLKAGDCNLRTYRLALACTGEYAQFHGGNNNDVMDAFVTSMVRVNGIYETDLGITMQLIPNNDDLIFLVGASDPYTNNNGGTMLGQNQSTIDDIIGSANYDIGHVYSTGGGGIASLNSPCNNNRKAQGVTGLGFPDGDPFWVDYVAHEMGHQFGGNHTQNNSCNRNGATAMEPGSASSIMGYAGICAPNVQNNSDDHFHAISLEEMTEYTTEQNGNSCAVIMDTGNTAPTIAPQTTAFTLPVDTPFRLGMEASDEDESDVLTYCWEQMDNEIGNMPPSPTNTQGPAFRSISPHLDPYRYFPNIQSIINNTTPTWEVLPILSRAMSFRGTVRDNHPLNGCTAEVDVSLTFDENAGPFRVTSQNEIEEWFSNTSQIVTWDVAGTDMMSPNPATMVDIFFSDDGGLTYPYVLAEDVPNNGEAEVLAPLTETIRGRVLVQGSDNVFFDINDSNIRVNATDFLISVSPEKIETCDVQETSFSIIVDAQAALMEAVELSVANVPDGLEVSLPQSSVTEDTEIVALINGVDQMMPGEYTFDIVASTSTQTISTPVFLEILTSTLTEPFLESPVDGETGVGLRPNFKWITNGNVQAYQLEIATSQTFENSIVIDDPNAVSGELLNGFLELNTLYYWRISASNNCASASAVSNVQRFQTGKESCESFDGLTLPVTISATGTGISRSLGNVTLSNIQASSIKVSTVISHSAVGDLGITLQSPDGTVVNLMDRPGVPATSLGCIQDNLNVTFDDKASMTAEAFENTCNSGEPSAITGSFQPIDPLGVFTGLDPSGVWFFDVEDFQNNNGGEIIRWTLEACFLEESTQMLSIVNDTFFVNKGVGLEITDQYLFTDDSNPAGVRYILNSLPMFGDIQLMDENGSMETLGVGDEFSQEDITSNRLIFQSDDLETDDQFMFDVLNSEGLWLPDNIFNIRIFGTSATSELGFDLDLGIMPNPGDGIFTLVFNTDKSSRLSMDVLSLDGKKVNTQVLNIQNGYRHKLNLTDYPDGTYLLILRDELGARNTYSLVKQ